MLGWVGGGQRAWSRRMEFAERHLRERGWRGKGLGRREDGISEPITVKVKCDKAGIGHRMGEQFTFHWWDHIFNKAADNVLVDTAEHGVRLRQAGSDSEQPEDGPVNNRKPRKAQQCRHLLYGRFIKTATLTPGTEGEVPVPPARSDTSDSDEDEKLDLSSTTRLTDEELVRVCGGRTGHKGARHGVTMNAKLLRLEAQEREFLAKYRQEPAAGGVETETGTERRTKKKKKKKKKRRQSFPGGGEGEERPRGEVTVGGSRERRKRRKGRGREEEVEGEQEGELTVGKRRKRQGRKEVEGEQGGEERLQGEDTTGKRRKGRGDEGREERLQGDVTAGKRRKHRGREEEMEGEERLQGEVTAGKRRKGRGREVEVEGELTAGKRRKGRGREEVVQGEQGGEERLQGEDTAGEGRKGRGDEEGEVATGGAEEGEGQERAVSVGKRRKLRREEKERLQGQIPAEEIGVTQGGRPEGEAGAGGRGKRRKAERSESERWGGVGIERESVCDLYPISPQPAREE